MHTDRRVLPGKSFGPIMCLEDKTERKDVTNIVVWVKIELVL